MNTPSKEHVGDLVVFRCFMREIMKEVGHHKVANALSRVAPSSNKMLRNMYEEEYNLHNPFLPLEKKFWVTIDDDISMLATPKVDRSIVRNDDFDDDVQIIETPTICS